ncbi:hypothetical protein AB0897_13670 [Streptomyces sp. NPDC007168]|uniref:hypothetical protein n=3 Tax=unclassified Streptomyces TaxID=2593676 RepID=UPI003454294A
MQRATLPGRRRRSRLLRRGTASTALATVAAVLAGLMYAVPATADEPGDNPADPYERTLRISLGARDRQDRCQVGRYINYGGPAVKGVANTALSGSQAGIAEAAQYWNSTPVLEAGQKDDEAGLAYWRTWQSRQTKLNETNQPYAGTNSSNGRPYHAPEFGEDIVAFTLGTQSDVYDQAYKDPTPRPGKPALDKARQVFDAIDTTGDDWATSYKTPYAENEIFGWGGSGTGSSHDVANLLRYGGFPTKAPEPGSMEYRTEVETLKLAWAGCDSDNPIDHYRVLTAPVLQAHVEWEAEYSSQTTQRREIVTAEAAASKETRTAADAMIEAIRQAWQADQILFWQKYWAANKDSIFYPTAAQFTKATADLKAARAAAAAQVTVADAAVARAKTASDKAVAQQASAWTIADAAKLPRGRGLMYAQQSVQVARASHAATQAAAKATLTASNAANATVATSSTLYALSQTQAHAVNTEFRKAAALEAAAQAKAAATAAAAQAAEAAANATTAKAAQATAEKAEQTARTAAATAKAEREKAEKEKATATAERKNAEVERDKASAAESRAQTERAAASRFKGDAETAGATATVQREAAEAAELRAAVARDDAVEAEKNKQATASRAASLEARAAAMEGTASAGEARQAATEARAAATAASGAASRARTAADEASTSAVNARAAATRAEGAASRSRAHADQAWSAYQTSFAAAQTAHAAAAEAIDAAAAAATNAKNAEAAAIRAKAAAAEARKQATAAMDEAVKTAAWAAKTAGFAFAAGQAASAARDSATEVIKPAHEAISLGSPYRETDPSAAFAVLIGQTSKNLAEQQASAAEAKAAEARTAAATAKALADKAAADSKIAANAAAAAAADTVKALASAAAAKASAAEAATAATAAKKSDVNATSYTAAAGVEAGNAEFAARGAESEAAAADSAATEAEKDASSARAAATAAETDASSARATATQAETDATAAETAAANANTSAKEADEAADRAEEEARKELEAARKAAMEAGGTGVSGGAGTGLTGDDEAILRAQCGQVCVDQYKAAMASADADVVDWLKANSGEVLLELIGVNDVKRCFGQGDVESCLWTLVDAVSLLALVGKIPAVAKAVVSVTRGISKFFEAAETGKNLIAQYKRIAAYLRKNPGCLTEQVTSASSAKVARAALAAHCVYMPGPIPDASEINRGSLVKISDNQLKKVLATIDEDPHSVKGELGGKIASWDNFREKTTGRIIFVKKGGKILYPTNIQIRL